MIRAGAAIAVALAAVALYFLAFEPGPPPPIGRPAATQPASQATLPASHPSVATAPAGSPPHPQVGSPGRVVRLPESVRGRWKAVALRVEQKAGPAASERLVVTLHGEAAIPGSPLKVRAVEFLPALQVKEGEITSAGNEPTNPAALVVISEQGKERFRGWLFAKFPEMQPFEHPAYRITLVEGVAKKQ